MPRRFIFPFVVLSLLISTKGQLRYETPNFQSNKSDFFSNIQTDAAKFYNVGIGLMTSPLHFDSDDWILTGIIAGSAMAGASLDHSVRNTLQTTRSSQLDKITMFGEGMGNPKYGTAISSILYIGGHLIGDKYLRETGQMLAEAIIFNGIITTGLKLSLNRSRPFTQDGNMTMEPFAFEYEDDEMSFPSGHTSTAFTIATVLSERIDNLYASVALYSLASLTAYQRIYADKHWFSDTLVGAALGVVVGLKVIKLHSEYDGNNAPRFGKLNVSPYVSQSNYGVNLRFTF